MALASSEWFIQENGNLQFFGAALNGGRLPLSGENGILRATERLATDREATRMLAKMSPELSLIYRVSRVLKVRCFRLAELQIGDVDLRGRTATIEGQEVPLCEDLVALLTAAAGDRDEGPVFLTPKGRQWTSNRLNKTFGKVKRLFDIDSGGKRVLI